MAKEYTARTLREIVRIVAGRFAGIVVIFAIIVASVTLATLTTPKWYRSEAEILVSPERTMEPAENTASLRDRVSLFVITQRKLILTDYVLASALMRLEGMSPRPGSVDEGERKYQPSHMQWYDKKEADEYIAGHARHLEKIRRRIDVQTPGGPEAAFTQVFAVTVDWPEERELAGKLKPRRGSKELAAERANLLTQYLLQAYLKRWAQLRYLQTKARADFLSDEQLREEEIKLQQIQAERQRFLQEEVKDDLPLLQAMRPGGTGVESGTAILSRVFREDISEIDTELAYLQSLHGAIDRQLTANVNTPGGVVVPDAVTTANPLISALQEKILSLKLRINELKPRFTPQYKDLKDATAELAEAEKELYSELKNQKTRLEQNIASLQAKKRILQRDRDNSRGRAEELASKAAKYDDLQRRLENAEASYANAREQSLGAQTARKFAERRDAFMVTVMAEPSVPDPAYPRRPILWLNVLIAVAAGLVLSLSYAFLADHFDHSIKGIDEAERYLGTPVLASVPKLGRNIIRRQ